MDQVQQFKEEAAKVSQQAQAAADEIGANVAADAAAPASA